MTRAALENFVTNVRVGNQTALRAAASPFAGYIVAMHNRIHRTFADGFIPGLAALPESSPLNDRSLHTTLETVPYTTPNPPTKREDENLQVHLPLTKITMK